MVTGQTPGKPSTNQVKRTDRHSRAICDSCYTMRFMDPGKAVLRELVEFMSPACACGAAVTSHK